MIRFAAYPALLFTALLVSGCQPAPPNVCKELGANALVRTLASARNRAQVNMTAKDFGGANALLLTALKSAIAAQRKIPLKPDTVMIDDRGLVLNHASYEEQRGMPDVAARERLGTLDSYIDEIRAACATPDQKVR